MTGLARASRVADAALRGIAALLLAAVTALVTASAVGRYFIGTPNRMIEEVSGLLMVALLFVALAVPGREGHIRVELVADRAKGPWRLIFRLAALVIMLLFAGMFAWDAWEQTRFNFNRNIKTELGGIAIWPWSAVMVAALAILALRSAIAFLQGDDAPRAGPARDGT